MSSPKTPTRCSSLALALLSVALNARREGDAERALKVLDRAVSLDNRCADAIRARGLLLMEMGELERAATDLDWVVCLIPDCARCQLERGTILLARGRPEEALAAAQRALSLSPELPAAHASRAAALLRLGRPEEALEAISVAVAARPHSDRDLHNRAVVRTALGQHAEAIRDYERALAIDPTSGGSHNNLAWLLATTPDPALRDGPRALRHARAALEQARIAAWLDTLAAAHAECGHFEAAVRAEAEACRSFSPGNDAFCRRLQVYRDGLSYAAWRERHSAASPGDRNAGGRTARGAEPRSQGGKG
jgi:tetratricopeptide (TPR) repeat protein